MVSKYSQESRVGGENKKANEKSFVEYHQPGRDDVMCNERIRKIILRQEKWPMGFLRLQLKLALKDLKRF